MNRLRRCLTAISGFVVVAITVSCGGSDVAGSDAGASAKSSGRALYESACAGCHGVDGKGAGSLGNDLVGGEFIRTHTDREVVALVERGRSTSDPANTTGIAMPPRGAAPLLTDTQLRDIVSYLRSLSGRAGEASRADNGG